MYRAREQIEHAAWLDRLERAADRLELGETARSRAADLFLSTVPRQDRSKRAALAASLYAGSLIGGDQRSQQAVADEVGVSRLAVQQRWKPLLREAGLDPPEW